MTATTGAPLVRLADVAQINPTWDKNISLNDPVSFVGMANMSDEAGRTMDEESRTVIEVRKGFTPFRRDDLLIAKITPCFENGKIGRAAITNRLGAGSTEFHVVRPGKDIDGAYALHFLRRPHFRAAGELRMTGSGGQRRVPASYVAETKIPLPPLEEQRRIATILDKADELRTKRREALAHLDTLTQSIFHSMFGSGIPAHSQYPVVRMGDVLQSATYGSSEKAAQTGELPILRMGNLTYWGELDLRDLKYVKAEQPEKYLLRSGDVIFNRTNSAGLVGKTAIYTGTSPIAYAGYLVRLRTSTELLPEYLAAFMNLRSTKALLRNMAKSIVGMANINAKEVQAIRLPLPPSELQQQFATRLAAVERLKETHRKHLAELDALFASLQHRAFKGEL